jgi:hypothetical protein
MYSRIFPCKVFVLNLLVIWDLSGNFFSELCTVKHFYDPFFRSQANRAGEVLQFAYRVQRWRIRACSPKTCQVRSRISMFLSFTVLIFSYFLFNCYINTYLSLIQVCKWSKIRVRCLRAVCQGMVANIFRWCLTYAAFKGTDRPHQIGLRVLSLESYMVSIYRTVPRNRVFRFNFLNLLLNIWNEFKMEGIGKQILFEQLRHQL